MIPAILVHNNVLLDTSAPFGKTGCTIHIKPQMTKPALL